MKKRLVMKLVVIWISAVLHFVNAGAADLTQNSCIGNTREEGQCKDCCDCLDGDAATRQSCRDACPLHDFTQNSSFITVNAPSVLGPDGDYSAALNAGSEQECKLYCDGSSELACGDRRYCRDQCNAADFNDAGDDDPPAPDSGGISIEQAVSDEAQGNTIAFDGMAFLTGDLCSNTFLPPGKVADFSGFQYLRDTDPSELGHNTAFVTIIAYNMWNILTEAQRTALRNLATTQTAQISQYGYGRLPLVKAFVRLLNGDIPAGSTGLDRSKVMAYSAELYELDGQISYDRAQTLGSILRGMSTDQKAQLDALKASGIINWHQPTDEEWKALSLNVEVSTYASEMYSWYAGDVEADTYFCPERQGTYFGSFYMKDMPAMIAEPGSVTISSSLTADVGTDFLNVLDTTQKSLVTNLIDIQRNDLYEIVTTRRLISTELRKFITQSSVDPATVLNLARRYGELDGEIIYNYANNFVQVSKTMTAAQKSQLLTILPKYEWDRVACTGYGYLYSEKLQTDPNIESIHNTDDFFTADSASSPYAWFSFSPSTPSAGQTITFTDSSSGSPTSWSWSFGDGTTSTAQNPTHTYSTAGTYTVSLTATNAKGSGSSNRNIIVTATSGGTLGDINNDGNVNLSDVISGLKVMSGISVTPVNIYSDVNGDGRIGLQEVIYVMNKVADSSTGTGSFTLTSDAGADGGTLPTEYACVQYGGAGSTIALAWSDAPAGTAEYALLMTTIALDGTKWNWVLYSIPATATGLAKNSTGVGTLGVGSDLPGRVYNPPCPQGPGAKLYTFTLYALSASPTLPAADLVTGAVLTDAISSVTLDSASLNLSYSP